jgi:hypothetical protein
MTLSIICILRWAVDKARICDNIYMTNGYCDLRSARKEIYMYTDSIKILQTDEDLLYDDGLIDVE